MSEELYNSNDFCKLAEEFEELKKENAELSKDKDRCIWVMVEDPNIDLWWTSCGEEFLLEAGNPSDNHMKYCCYCGKEIAEGYVPANADIPFEISENELGAQEAEKRGEKWINE